MIGSAYAMSGLATILHLYSAVTTGPAWSKTVLVINFDEWGGFFDHVPPPLAPLPDADRAAGSDGRVGFRTPTLLISPFAHRAHTSHVVYDHTSILRLIEWRWNLEPLTVRDATANNPADELDFKNPQLLAPAYAVPPVVGLPCPGNPVLASSRRSLWAELRRVSRARGWRV